MRGLEDFKEWIAEDRKALPDIEVTIVDDIGEQNNIALGWTWKPLKKGKFLDFQLAMKSLTLVVSEVFHFENGKIKEVWTIYDGLKLALELCLVEIVQPQDSNKWNI